VSGNSWLGLALRILLVEDDKRIGSAVRDHIAADGHAADWAQSLLQAREFADVARYGLTLLDLQLPDGSGVEYLRAMRAREDRTPVIVLTARDQISDRIEGLNAGADDYLVKPFDLGELSARIHAVARRAGAAPSGPSIKFGGVEIVSADRIAKVDGVIVELTGREWAVLDALSSRPGATIPKNAIDDALYEFGAEVESNTVEVYVSRLRKKLGAKKISTLRGVGYRLAV
jgi:two-component system, OmpR family, response regulator